MGLGLWGPYSGLQWSFCRKLPCAGDSKDRGIPLQPSGFMRSCAAKSPQATGQVTEMGRDANVQAKKPQSTRIL